MRFLVEQYNRSCVHLVGSFPRLKRNWTATISHYVHRKYQHPHQRSQTLKSPSGTSHPPGAPRQLLTQPSYPSHKSIFCHPQKIALSPIPSSQSKAWLPMVYMHCLVTVLMKDKILLIRTTWCGINSVASGHFSLSWSKNLDKSVIKMAPYFF